MEHSGQLTRRVEWSNTTFDTILVRSTKFLERPCRGITPAILRSFLTSLPRESSLLTICMHLFLSLLLGIYSACGRLTCSTPPASQPARTPRQDREPVFEPNQVVASVGIDEFDRDLFVRLARKSKISLASPEELCDHNAKVRFICTPSLNGSARLDADIAFLSRST
jgi:hypothetical protein